MRGGNKLTEEAIEESPGVEGVESDELSWGLSRFENPTEEAGGGM
jgi:hypothetical protein